MAEVIFIPFVSSDAINNAPSTSIVAEYDLGTHDVLPEPPEGFLWSLQGYYTTEADDVTFGILADGDFLAGAELPAGTIGGYADGTTLDGGIVTDGEVQVAVLADGPVKIVFFVSLLPLDQGFRVVNMPQLTDAYAAVPLPTIPAGMALKTLPASTTGGWPWMPPEASWVFNDSTNVETGAVFRLTRGGNSIEFAAGVCVPGLRNSYGVPQLPAFLPGDVLEVRTLDAVVGVFALGILFKLVPALTLTP